MYAEELVELLKEFGVSDAGLRCRNKYGLGARTLSQFSDSDFRIHFSKSDTEAIRKALASDYYRAHQRDDRHEASTGYEEVYISPSEAYPCEWGLGTPKDMCPQ